MSPKEFAIPRASMSDIIEETKSKNSSREIYLAAYMDLYTRSFSVCEPLAPSKFIWKFAKFVLYQRSLSPQSLRTLSLPIHIDRNDRAITQLLFTHAMESNYLFLKIAYCFIR